MLPEDKFAFLPFVIPLFMLHQEEAAKSALRKVNALNHEKTDKPVLNFGGQSAWSYGAKAGSWDSITQMIYESVKYTKQCLWFPALVSKKGKPKKHIQTTG